MLDHAFIAIARGMAPVDKKNMRFLSRLMMALDPALGDIPLDARPAPQVYAAGGVYTHSQMALVSAKRVVRKVRQRASHQRRVPAGGAIVAAKVLDYWRQEPSALDGVRALEIMAPQYLDRMVSGEIAADSSTVGFVANLESIAKLLSP
jgi:asparagine synthase (glutamine-hydrolysing)